MIRKLMTGFLLSVAVCLTGCGNKKEVQETEKITVQDIYDVVEKVNPVANPREIDDFALENDFGFEQDGLVINYVGTISNTMTDSGLNLVIEAAEGRAEEVKTILETYQKNQQTFFGGYYAEFADALAQISEGRIVVEGNFVILVFANTEGTGYDEIDGAIEQALKKGIKNGI